MNLFDLEEKREVKTVRVLVYPNITFQKDLEKDSYIQVIRNQIKLLNEIRDDLWFYLILPCHVPILDFNNVHSGTQNLKRIRQRCGQILGLMLYERCYITVWTLTLLCLIFQSIHTNSLIHFIT